MAASASRQFTRFASTALFVSLSLLAPGAAAQGPGLTDSIVGGWKLSAITLVQDGVKSEPYGGSPNGFASFHRDGRFSYMIIRSDLPRLANANRFLASPEEMKTIFLGTYSYYGRYSIDEAAGVMTLHVEASAHPNRKGTDEKRAVTIVGDEMRLTNFGPSVGGTSYAVWRRAAR